MKKTVFLFAAMAVAISCKEDGEKDKIVDNQSIEKGRLKLDDATCMTLDNYPSNANAYEQARWLRENDASLCEGALFKAVQGTHKIKKSCIYVQSGDSLKKAWSDIETLIRGKSPYGKYIGFKMVNNDIVDFEELDTFTQTRPCYSIALFKSIDVINALNPGDTLVFKNAKVNSSNTIVFDVINNNSGTRSHYDFSDNPKGRSCLGSKHTKSPL